MNLGGLSGMVALSQTVKPVQEDKKVNVES
jgi:hypothetical protein